jgi:hypothetical protein
MLSAGQLASPRLRYGRLVPQRVQHRVGKPDIIPRPFRADLVVPAVSYQVAQQQQTFKGPKNLEGGRHTARSLAGDAGVDRDISQRTGGWATEKMSDHYNHPEAARFRQAAEDVARHVSEAGS